MIVAAHLCLPVFYLCLCFVAVRCSTSSDCTSTPVFTCVLPVFMFCSCEVQHQF